ncbi:DUF6624 domain-containing protein [Flavivirga sp. 57AJ16]|uniref:DUF6624 domain-containing protein n=1 Tax=Flavivirga sp. 57AJ16 TaxID=3025307 RepID=UPI0023668632|nr:DUF6624 domain-containing protein [Flavivirga sp. 57AJ16]MDD7886217.1 hypothetical protein [Flavivirga sp. 57AJ16]
MDTKIIAQKIIGLKNQDEKLRNELIKSGNLSKGYNKEMEALHNSNAKELNQLIDEIGYPTKDKVGKEASEAAWLIIQHTISQPNFMRKCAKLLSEAVKQKKANPISLAYLTDRIAVFEGKPQRYGTQFDWNKNGDLRPNQYDDLIKVNKRRKSIGLNALEEQIQVMQKRVEKENQSPPIDFQERKIEYDNWRKSVGWIK